MSILIPLNWKRENKIRQTINEDSVSAELIKEMSPSINPINAAIMVIDTIVLKVVLVRHPSWCSGISVFGARSRSLLISRGRLGRTSTPTKNSVSTWSHARGPIKVVTSIKIISCSTLYARYKLKPCKRSNTIGMSGPELKITLPERMIIKYTLMEEDRNSVLIHHHL